MSGRLRNALAATDVLFLSYWAITALAALHIIHLPAALLFAGYHDPRVVAWNWSFFPLDLAFSLTGLAAVSASRWNNPIWRPLALISLTLTTVAGLMAVGYWTILGEFDPSWFLPNLAILIWPFFFLPDLVKGFSGPA